MKIESQIQIAASGSQLELYADGPECAALFAGDSKVLGIGRIKTGSFDESLGLAEKLCRHLANGALSASAESENVIPFGCEYRVKRQWKFSGNIGELTDDIAADNGGIINDLALEPVTFYGAASEVSVLLDGENSPRVSAADGVIYDGETLPVAVKVLFKDGHAAEFYCGDDFWRHRCASALPGGKARHTITAGEDRVVWERKVLTLPEDVEAEKRPWRFKTLFAVSGENTAAGTQNADLQLNGCAASPVIHKQLRRFIRKQQENSAVVIGIAGDICCEDGSHVSRPGKKIAHGMLGEIFDEYIWSNSVMARKSGCCTVELNILPLSASVIAGNLRKAPEKLNFPDWREEDEENL